MLEYPEIKTIARQMQETLPGKQIMYVEFPGLERKFVFSEVDESTFQQRLIGTTIEHVESCGNHLFIFTDKETVLNIGDTGGKLLFHPADATVPSKYDLKVTFAEGSKLTLSVQMWGFLNIQTPETARTLQRRILEEAREPFEERVTLDDFQHWLHDWEEAPKVNAKKFIVSRKYFTGIGNGYTQDILWKAKLHPRRKMDTLTQTEATALFHGFREVVRSAVEHDGRETERDFFNQPGKYAVLLGNKTLGTPCPACGTAIIKFSFEGGACYICPSCQVDSKK